MIKPSPIEALCDSAKQVIWERNEIDPNQDRPSANLHRAIDNLEQAVEEIARFNKWLDT